MTTTTQLLNTIDMFDDFKHYMTTYPIKEVGVSVYLQRLKILAHATGSFISFNENLISEISDVTKSYESYIVYSDFLLQHSIQHIKINAIPILQLFPVRSLMFDVYPIENKIVIRNYSVPHIISLQYNEFIQKVSDSLEVNEQPKLYITYEGAMLIAYKDIATNEWKLRTTACNAFESYYNSTKSYGELFNTTIQDITSIDWKENLNKLSTIYNNHYFVFQLISSNNSYLCSYNNNTEFGVENYIMLCNIRQSDTGCEEDITTQNIVPFQTPITYEKFNTIFLQEQTFDNAKLKIQGFMLNNNGVLYRIYTNAYLHGTMIIPNTNNLTISYFISYLQNTLYLNTTFNNVAKELIPSITSTCSNILSGIRYLFTYILFTFTKIQFSADYNAPKTYKKLNQQLYQSLTAPHCLFFKKIHLLLQNFLITNNYYNNTYDTNHYIDMFIRAYITCNDSSIQIFNTLLSYYTAFTDELTSKVIAHNESGVRYTVKGYTNNFHTLLQSLHITE